MVDHRKSSMIFSYHKGIHTMITLDPNVVHKACAEWLNFFELDRKKKIDEMVEKLFIHKNKKTKFLFWTFGPEKEFTKQEIREAIENDYGTLLSDKSNSYDVETILWNNRESIRRICPKYKLVVDILDAADTAVNNKTTITLNLLQHALIKEYLKK